MQFISGHVTFRTYVKRIGKTDDERYLYCGEIHTPEYGVRLCNVWLDKKRRLDLEMRVEIIKTNIIGTMVSS